jgi:hypothetical protein
MILKSNKYHTPSEQITIKKIRYPLHIEKCIYITAYHPAFTDTFIISTGIKLILWS